MLPRYLLAPTLLFAWQVAPVGIVRDESGSLRVAFGGALGEYEEQSFNCSTGETDRQRVTYRTVGGSAEYRPAESMLRVEAHAGGVSPDGNAGRVSGSVTRGWYATGLVAMEDQRVGYGLGIAYLPAPVFDLNSGPDHNIRPTAYLRVGRTERFHGRIDVNTPDIPGAMPDKTRISVGQGWGSVDRFSWRVSVSETHFPDSVDDWRLGAAIAVPTGRGFVLGAAVSSFDTGKSAGLFAQYRFGRKVRGTP
ncbi:MAG TPA: hypothetical protein VMK53_02525 [Gemmatimonadales bacterium]|nr:hypothetical protein [Gemmatimonadales bacterium]